MSTRVAIVLAIVVSASLGFIAGYVLWRAPQAPQPVEFEQQQRKRLPERMQHDSPKQTQTEAPPTEVWAQSQLVSELGKALAVTSLRERDDKLEAIVKHVDPAYIPELAAALTKEPPSQASNGILMDLIDTWADTDLKAAFQFSLTLDNVISATMISGLFERLMEDDRAYAESYLANLSTESKLRDSLTYTLVEGVVQEDPTKASKWVATLPPEAQAKHNSALYHFWAGNDPEGAFAAAVKLPKGNARDHALEAAAGSWIHSDPSAALDFVAKQDDEQLLVMAMQQVDDQIATDNPDLFASYLGKMPAGTERDNMFEAFAAQWAAKDFTSVKAWAMSLRDASDRDKALAGLVRGYAYVGGKNSTDVLAEIHDPQLRARAADTVCARLGDTNAAQRCWAEYGSAEHDTEEQPASDAPGCQCPRATRRPNKREVRYDPLKLDQIPW